MKLTLQLIVVVLIAPTRFRDNLFKFTLYTIIIYKVGNTRCHFRRHVLIQHNFSHEIRKFHPGIPEVTFLGTDTSFAQSHPPLLEKILDRRQLFFLANHNSPEQTPHTRLNLNGYKN